MAFSSGFRCTCGALFVTALDWCPQCYQAKPAPGESGADPVRERPADPISPRRARSGLGRWDASDITFGWRGRVIATILFTLPMILFLWYFFPFGFVGVVAYGSIYPRGLREIWTRADRL